MITSFLLAFVLIALSIFTLATLDKSIDLAMSIFRTILRFTRRSKLLTEYVLRAYLRYRKALEKTQYHAV